MIWASMVRAQMQLLVVTYHCSNGRAQAAGVYRIDGIQPGGPHAGYVQQVACRDADVLNGALVGGDDGSGEFRIIITDS